MKRVEQHDQHLGHVSESRDQRERPASRDEQVEQVGTELRILPSTSQNAQVGRNRGQLAKSLTSQNEQVAESPRPPGPLKGPGPVAEFAHFDRCPECCPRGTEDPVSQTTLAGGVVVARYRCRFCRQRWTTRYAGWDV